MKRFQRQTAINFESIASQFVHRNFLNICQINSHSRPDRRFTRNFAKNKNYNLISKSIWSALLRLRSANCCTAPIVSSNTECPKSQSHYARDSAHVLSIIYLSDCIRAIHLSQMMTEWLTDEMLNACAFKWMSTLRSSDFNGNFVDFLLLGRVFLEFLFASHKSRTTTIDRKMFLSCDQTCVNDLRSHMAPYVHPVRFLVLILSISNSLHFASLSLPPRLLHSLSVLSLSFSVSVSLTPTH